jgi:hypothetical protein
VLQRTKPATCAVCVLLASVHVDVTVTVYSPSTGVCFADITYPTLIGPPELPFG